MKTTDIPYNHIKQVKRQKSNTKQRQRLTFIHAIKRHQIRYLHKKYLQFREKSIIQNLFE